MAGQSNKIDEPAKCYQHDAGSNHSNLYERSSWLMLILLARAGSA